jgi:hypothetical protein
MSEVFIPGLQRLHFVADRMADRRSGKRRRWAWLAFLVALARWKSPKDCGRIEISLSFSMDASGRGRTPTCLYARVTYDCQEQSVLHPQDHGGGDSNDRVPSGGGWVCGWVRCMEGLRPTEAGSRGIDWLC